MTDEKRPDPTTELDDTELDGAAGGVTQAGREDSFVADDPDNLDPLVRKRRKFGGTLAEGTDV